MYTSLRAYRAGVGGLLCGVEIRRGAKVRLFWCIDEVVPDA